jgi:hypothetical protein
MTLPEETRALLHQQMARAQANLDLEAGKMFLTSGDFDRAKDSIEKANHFFHRAKLKLAILGLQFAPRLIRLAVITWQRLVSRSGPAESIPNLRVG